MDRSRPPTRLLIAVIVLTVVAGTPATAVTPTTEGVCQFPFETTDATGTAISLDSEPERVVTLFPSAAQTMWEIGSREKVVGLTRYASYLEGSASRANVSGASSIVVVETVVALSPDLVLAPNATPAATVDQLRGAGLTVYRLPRAETIGDVYAKTRTIGRLVGECHGAEATVARMRERVGTAREAADGKRRPDVLYAFFGYTAGRGTFIHEVIEAAGGNNVAADYGVTGYRQLSPEVVVEADPDWIIRNSNDPVLPEGAPFNETTAVREGNVLVVPIQHLNQPAPRIAEGVTTLASAFYPEAFAPVNATAQENDGTSADRTEPNSTSAPPAETPSTETTDSPGQPGFSAVVAIGALIVAALLVRRW